MFFEQFAAATCTHLFICYKNKVRQIGQQKVVFMMNTDGQNRVGISHKSYGCNFQIIMAEQDSLHNSKIKTFEQKIINQSFMDIHFYDKLADYLLECCHAEAKPNTLSLFSCLPLILLTVFVNGPSRLACLFTFLCILVHMLCDIANKKQAYRLSSFTLSTYYIDHVFDAISCVSIVFIMGIIMQLSRSAVLTAVFFLGMLPFYTHHLAMYNNEYMTFPKVSPATEGLILTKLLLICGLFYPQFFQLQLFNGYTVSHAYVSVCVLWVSIFVLMDVYVIIVGKRVTDAKSGTEEHMPIKNVFVIIIIGYLVLEITSIQTQMLDDGLYFYLAFAVLAIYFVHIIGNLILSYGYNESYKQISLPLLAGTGVVVIYYALVVFKLRYLQSSVLISKCVLGVLLLFFTLWFVRQSGKHIIHINQVLSV